MKAEELRLRGILREINRICHIPADATGHWPTYTLDHADFHRILELTEEFAEDDLPNHKEQA